MHRARASPRLAFCWTSSDEGTASEFGVFGLVESGVEILRAPAPSPCGLTFTFVDPDGYAVTVHDQS